MTTSIGYRSWLLAIALLVGRAGAGWAEDFYKGKTIRVIVGQAAGGGYDTYGRLIARHIGKHIPGNPATTAENMEGAGSLISANYIYRQAKPDGLTMVMFNNSLVVQNALGDPRIKIDFRKLGWVGAPSVGVPVCMIMGFTGLKTLDDVVRTKMPLKAGATRAGSAGYDLPLILNETLGTKIEVISGFTGTATTRVALQKREINTFCSQWESMRVTARAMLDAQGGDKLIPFVISERWEDPEVKDLPLFKDAIKDPKKYVIFRAWAAQMDFQRPFTVAPGTPKDRLAILRKALAATLKDPELLAEAKKSKLVITPVSGEETEKLAEEILSMPAQAKKSLSFRVRNQGG
jgi:tripartite-type tricarboxylate transporter receptor subunit TctC